MGDRKKEEKKSQYIKIIKRQYLELAYSSFFTPSLLTKRGEVPPVSLSIPLSVSISRVACAIAEASKRKIIKSTGIEEKKDV